MRVLAATLAKLPSRRSRARYPSAVRDSRSLTSRAAASP